MPSSRALRTKGHGSAFCIRPIEGKLEGGFEGMEVGDRLRVQLISTDVERGYIDFKTVG